jgi:hypothetical protein
MTSLIPTSWMSDSRSPGWSQDEGIPAGILTYILG